MGQGAAVEAPLDGGRGLSTVVVERRTTLTPNNGASNVHRYVGASRPLVHWISRSRSIRATVVDIEPLPGLLS
jgi:hypothetical protein